jgi:cell wall-associated NlpC family hydrolase
MSGLHWSSGFVGLPWADRGRTRAGCDCWGLVRLVYREVAGIDLPSFDEAYVTAEEQSVVAAVIADVRQGGRGASPWLEVAGPPERLDLLLFRCGRHESHVGVVVDPRRALMLHSQNRDQSRIESFDRAEWARRRIGFFRHQDASNPR